MAEQPRVDHQTEVLLAEAVAVTLAQVRSVTQASHRPFKPANRLLTVAGKMATTAGPQRPVKQSEAGQLRLADQDKIKTV